MLIKGRNSIEEKIKHERRANADIRRQLDVLKGLSRAKGAQRGDFRNTKDYDKILNDYRRFKNPKDRQKITSEYERLQRERRGLHG